MKIYCISNTNGTEFKVGEIVDFFCTPEGEKVLQGRNTEIEFNSITKTNFGYRIETGDIYYEIMDVDDYLFEDEYDEELYLE